MDKIVVIGGGGHAVSVLDTILSINNYSIVGFVDKEPCKEKNLFGVPCLGGDNILKDIYLKGTTNAAIAIGSIGDTGLRDKLYKQVKEIGFVLPVIIDPNAVVGRECTIGEGVFIGKGAVLNAYCEVGKMVIINSGALIEHQCKIGDFSHIAPSCSLSGNVTIGEHTHIGIGTSIIQGITVGSKTLIGAGSVVVKNIGSEKKAFGTPCREVGDR